MKKKKPQVKRSLFHKIVNVFIAFVASIIVLLVLFLGISQTSTFREYLRETIVDNVNSSINGKLHIEKIEGTILTTLSIRDISLSDSNKTTIFYSSHIELKVNPFKVLIGEILLREITINDAQLSLLQNSDGNWNIATLTEQGADSSVTNFETTDVKTDDKTNEDSGFPFVIVVNDLNLINMRFVLQSHNNLGNDKVYRYINFDDLIVENFNLSAKAIIDISKNNYSLNLKRLSFDPNVERFQLKKFSGIFVYQNKDAVIKDFQLISDDSNIKISARFDDVDLFNDFSLAKLQRTSSDVQIDLSPFVFDDLSSFLPVTNLLDKKVDVHLKANGPYGDLNIEELSLNTGKTLIQITGNVKNLHEPSDLFLDVKVFDSYASFIDVKELLPGVSLPDFNEIKLTKFNTEFKGKPTNFNVDMSANVDKGSINLAGKMNLDAEPITYDLNIKTSKLNLAPITNETSSLNINGKIKGRGIAPEELESNIDLNVNNSTYAGYKFDKVKLDSKSTKKIIELSLAGNFNNASVSTAGYLNFVESGKPKYDVEGRIDNLNLADLLKNDEYDSNLNFDFDANGHHFDLDSLYGMFNLRIDSSRYSSKLIERARLSLQVVKSEQNRNIFLDSDFADFTITGDFSLSNAVDVLSYEAGIISQIIATKVEQLSPLYKSDSLTVSASIPEEIISKELNFDFSFNFKDFELIAILLGEDKLDISGSGSGSVKNTRENFEINTDLYIEYLLTVGDDVFYISDLESDIKLSRNNASLNFEDFFGSVSLNCDRVYSGMDIESIMADIIFNQNKMFFNIKSLIDNKIGIETDGNFVFSPREQDVTLSNLQIDYNQTQWQNLRPIKLNLKPGQSLDVMDFAIYSGPAALFVNGIIYNDGRQNISTNLNDIDGELIGRLLTGEKNKLFDSKLNVDGYFSGTFTEPVIDFELNLDSVAYSGVKFGNLNGSASYENKNININAYFIDPSLDSTKKSLSISGNIPIDLNYQLEGERFTNADSLSIAIISEDFNLTALGNILPAVRNQSGFLSTNLFIKGNIENPDLRGNIELKKVGFNAALNNLEYVVNGLINFNGDTFELSNFTVKNSGGTNYIGTMNISGSGKLNNFVPENAELIINGDLALLSRRSRGAQPSLYGDLFVGTNGNWVFEYNESGSSFIADVDLKTVDLILIAESSGYQNGASYNYTFIKDTTNIDRIRQELEQIVASEKNQSTQSDDSQMELDYKLNITTDNIVKLEIILAQAVNQKLIVEALGNLKFESIAGRTQAQGSFNLLDGSKLEYFKTFEAEGSIRFESDITDPFLDVIATYKNDYLPPNGNTSEEVAVKLRLQGPVSELGTNLVSQTDNISVYVGSRNIENNIPDERYDASDAVSFILVNQFKADLSAQNRQDVANQTIGINTASSLLGSILTRFVNSAVGDVVNNIQLSQAGEDTKFAVSGRFSNFKYSFGGSTELFQNINKANLRVDYLFNPNFLIRLERKDPLVRTFGIEDKITELGLKYRFEF